MVDEVKSGKHFFIKGKKSWLKLVGFSTLFVLLSFFVPFSLYREVDSSFNSELLQIFTLEFFLACFALLLVYYTSDAMRLWFTLRAIGCSQALKSIFPLVFINFLFSNITPMATGGGIAQVWFLHRRGVMLGAATAATSIRTVLASLLIFIPTPFLFMINPQLSSDLLHDGWGVFLSVFAIGYVLLSAVVLLRIRWVIHTLKVILNQTHRFGLISQNTCQRRTWQVTRELFHFSYCIKIFLMGNWRDKLMAIGSTILFLVSLFSFPALLLWGLGYQVEYTSVLALMLVNTFIMYFAPTPGASGIAEGVFAIFFGAIVQAPDLVFVIIAWRFLTIHLGMFIGIFFTIFEFLSGAKND
ncbi:uncharacterized protein (TIRG00374 family) [Pseudoalteromonas sp. MBR-15]|jgi:uncharacterized protein (TIRG00374 family)